MKHLVLFLSMIFVFAASQSQITYRTAATGNYTNNATWVGGAGGKPLTTANSPACNCKIIISPGHRLDVDQNLSLTNVIFILEGAGSQLRPTSNGRTITLSGTATAIDIRVSTASLVRGQNNQTITINGTTVWHEDLEFQSTTNGTVQGPASVSDNKTTWSSALLPVKLSEFNVSKTAKGPLLVWKTTSEINSSHFEIQRSGDGKSFSSIGQVSAAGNTGVEQNYSFSDAAPADGTNYYRLKIVDIDEKFEYSPIKSVSFASSSLHVVAGPNPATSFINVEVTAPGKEPYRLRLVNRAGQVVFDQKYPASGNRIQLNVSNYTDGTYFLEVTNTSGLRELNKVMIIRK